MSLGPRENPRYYLPRHAERGPKRFTYTLDEVCRLASVTRQQLRRAKERGEVDPASFESVVNWAAQRYPRALTSRTDKALAVEEMTKNLHRIASAVEGCLPPQVRRRR